MIDDGAVERPQVSLVVPTYRRCASLRRLLRALEGQTIPPETFEVVVSIDGSEDGTREMVATYRAACTVRAIWQPNRGRAAACNAGIEAARGELIVILDDDMEPTPSFLAAHLSEHPAGSRVAVVGAAPIVTKPTSPPLLRYYAGGFNRRLEKLARADSPLTFREAYTGNFSIRREVIIEAGGFDADFAVYGHEDYELALRLRTAGVELRYSGKALAWQHYEKDFAALARDGVARGRTAVIFVTKHPTIADRLQLARYRHGPRAWRWVRSSLLFVNRLWPRTADLAIGAVTWIEARRVVNTHRFYRFALDYFYWVGVQAARRESWER